MTKHPRNSRAIGNLAGIYMQMSPPRLAPAESLYWQALRVDSLYTPALDHLATVAGMQGRFYDQHALLTRRLQLPPLRAAPYRRLGNLLVQHGNVTAGIGHLETAVRVQATDTTLVDLGRAYIAAGRSQDAVSALEAALQLNPSRVDALTDMAQALVKQGRRREAMEHLRRALALAPQYEPAQRLLRTLE
jgi:tetratricopeptide (TPR) repeat protein